MNERIKELAKEAGDYVNEVYTPPVRSKTPGKIWEDGHIDWLTQFNEKFAELIVRECEKSIKSVPTHFEAQDKIIVECLKAISEHFFGVEE
jgi:hypothetical protein